MAAGAREGSAPFLREAPATGSPGSNQLGTINGCFVPCLLTILGAVLFLQLGFSVGMMGMWGALAILCFSELVSYITISSFSAIVSNGRTQGGGAYFLIARNLGPAFGGSSGILFWISYCINATYNVAAFAQVFQSTFIPSDSWWGSTSNLSQPVISTITFFPLFLVAFKGAGTFAKVNWIVFIGLFIASVVVTAGLYFDRADRALPGTQGGPHTYTGFNLQTLRDNMWPDPMLSKQCEGGQVCTLQNIFSIIFPAVIGMMEGLNLSGDLKEPEKSIPSGTIWAVTVAFVLYALLLVGQAGTMNRAALQYEDNVLQKSTVGNGCFVFLGVATACLSTVLGSLFGAGRILQAMARDGVLPGLSIFKYGTASGDEPRPAIVLSYALAQGCVLLGGLDDISPLLTNFFLMTYVLTDLACFLLAFSRVPNFRPTFRYFSWVTSLLNCILLSAVMFYLSVPYGLMTFLFVTLIFLYISMRFRGRTDWIDIRQAVIYRLTRRGLLEIEGQRRDPKFWRPSFLLLTAGAATWTAEANPSSLVSFMSCLKRHGRGLLVVGEAVVAEQVPSVPASAAKGEESPAVRTQRKLEEAVPGFEGFVQTAVAPGGRLACYNLMIGAGVGTAFVPDTVVFPVCSRVPFLASDDLVETLRDALGLRKNLLLALNFPASGNAAAGFGIGPVDIWLFGEVRAPPLVSTPLGSERPASNEVLSHMSMLLQVGFLAHAKVRLFHVTHGSSSAEAGAAGAAGAAAVEEAVLRAWLRWARMPPVESEVHCLQFPVEATSKDLNMFIAEKSASAGTVMAMLPSLPPPAGTAPKACGSTVGGPGGALREAGMPALPAGGPPAEWLHALCTATANLPPTLLAMNGQGFPLITTVM